LGGFYLVVPVAGPVLIDCAVMPTYVAPMITDSVADNPPDSNSSLAADPTTALVLGAAHGQAVAVGYQSLAQSLSLLMLGDTNAHQAFASTSAAIVMATANLLLGNAGENNHG
jgi:hypothetical protein